MSKRSNPPKLAVTSDEGEATYSTPPPKKTRKIACTDDMDDALGVDMSQVSTFSSTPLNPSVGISPIDAWVYNEKIRIPWYKLRVWILFRGVHTDHVPALASDIETKGWTTTKQILCVQGETDEDYYLVDGVHRWMAVRWNVFQNKFPYEWSIPCVVLKRDTPDYLIIAEAGKQNTANEMFVQMTFADKIIWTRGIFFGLLSKRVDQPADSEKRFVASDFTKVSAREIFESVSTVRKTKSGVFQKQADKSGFAITTIEKMYGSLKFLYSALDFETETSALTVPEDKRPLTPYSLLTFVNNMTMAHKKQLRVAYKNAWQAVCKPMVAKSNARVITWPSVADDGSWGGEDVYTVGNIYADANVPGAISAEWKPKSGSASKLTDRPVTLFYMRCILGAYMFHGSTVILQQAKDIMTTCINKRTPAGPSNITDMWLKMFRIAEPDGKISETQMARAQKEADAHEDHTKVVNFPAIGNQGIINQLAEPPSTPLVQEAETAEGQLVRLPSSQSSHTGTTVDMVEGTPGFLAENDNPGTVAFAGCCYRTCEGKRLVNNELVACAECVKDKKLCTMSHACLDCISRKLVPHLPQAGPDVLRARALCLRCWRSKKQRENTRSENEEIIGEQEYQALVTRYSPGVVKQQGNSRKAKRDCLAKCAPGTTLVRCVQASYYLLHAM